MMNEICANCYAVKLLQYKMYGAVFLIFAVTAGIFGYIYNKNKITHDKD